jgi:hypothetical protein
MSVIKFSLEDLEKRKKINTQAVEKLISIGKINGEALEVDRDVYIENRRNGNIVFDNENTVVSKKKTVPNNPNVIANFTKSMTTWAGGGFKKVQQHVYENRLSICRKCEFWQENGNFGMGKCLKCGCGRGKHWLPHEQCPIGLWGKEQ